MSVSASHTTENQKQDLQGMGGHLNSRDIAVDLSPRQLNRELDRELARSSLQDVGSMSNEDARSDHLKYHVSIRGHPIVTTQDVFDSKEAKTASGNAKEDWSSKAVCSEER